MTNLNKRIKIPPKLEADVMFYSDRKCCVDQKKGVHIHHIDGNPSNNNFNNLALLCFDCHDEATKKGSLSKKLSAQTISRYREFHYEFIKKRRNEEINEITKKITNPTNIDSINASIQANVLIEIAKIKFEYSQSIKMDRNDILIKFYAFVDYNFPRVCAELFEFLNRVTYETRSGLPYNMIYTVTSLVEKYFPPQDNNITKSQIEKVGNIALQIAFGIIYDTSIYSNKFNSMKNGYDLLQFIYLTSCNQKINNLKKDVEATFSEIESTLNRPERNDLSLAKSMHNIYKEHLKSNARSNPELSQDLLEKVQNEKS